MQSGTAKASFPLEKHVVDYKETLHYFHDLAATRFKLLAIVPSFTGVALGTLLSPSQKGSWELIAIGVFGFFVVLGVVFYDARNTQIYDMMQIRAKSLEAYLGLPWAQSKHKRGGPLLNRPPRELKFVFIFDVWHDRGLAIVYSSCLAAWFYIILRGARILLENRLPPIWDYDVFAMVLPLLVWAGMMVQYKCWDVETDKKEKLTPWAVQLLEQAPDDLGFDEWKKPTKQGQNEEHIVGGTAAEPKASTGQ